MKVKKMMLKNKKFLNRGIALIMALSVSVSLIPVQTINAEESKTDQTVSEKTTETATETEPEEIQYQNIDINTAQDFVDFAEKCYIDSWSKDKYVTLKADIDLTEIDVETVPVFSGVFDGANHTISGFDYVGDGYVVGLFRYVESGSIIKSLTLKGNVESENEKECIGSICGVNYGTIRNCTFYGTVSGRDTVGGIAGINETTGTISGCTVKGRVTGYYSTGGITGINHGVLNYCTNSAGINDDSAWVEEDDEMGGVEIIKNLTSNDDNEVYSGVDTGGITGYSDGVISRCTNSGIVGYEHTGYNIGGIAGRQAGIVSLCTNNGTVYGRKDVGGVVGQMEPFIEIDEAESLRNAINKLHDLIDKTLDDMDETKDVLKSDVDTMQSYADSAIDTGDELIEQLSDFVDDNVDEVNSVAERMEHVMDMLPEVLDNVSYAGDSMSRLNDIMKQLVDDLDIMGKLDNSPYEETDYYRISLLSTVGGTITSDSTNPEKGDTVTITVEPDEGYELKADSLIVKDAKGNTVEIKNTASGKYTFEMPKENVKVTAEFVYKGTFLVKSNEGGTVKTTIDGDKYTFEPNASSGYEFSKITVGGEEKTLTDGKLELNRNDYIKDNKSVAVEVTFKEMTGTKYKVNVSYGTGGSARAGSSEAVEGEEVTITVVSPSSNYEIDKITVNGEEGKCHVSTDNANQYVFTMPARDANVEVTFKYKMGDSAPRVYAESGVGGTISAAQSSSNSDLYTLTVTPQDGYKLSDSAITVKVMSATGTVTVQKTEESKSQPESSAEEDSSEEVQEQEQEGEAVEETKAEEQEAGSNEEVVALATGDKSEGTISKADMTEEDGRYKYIFNAADYVSGSIRVYANFEKDTSKDDTATYTISTVSGTGGTVGTDASSASSGDTVYITPASSSGYVLKELKALNTSDQNAQISCQKENDGKRYSFTMPAGNVKVTAVYEPIDIALSSNLSGSASYSGNSEGIVTLTINPSSAYTLDGAPVVKDAEGKSVTVSKKQSGSYVYEFDLSGITSPCTADIKFKKQNKKQAIDTSKDEIEKAIDELTEESDNVQKSVDKIKDIVENPDGSVKSWDQLTSDQQQEVIGEVLNLVDYLGEMSSSAATILRNLATIYNILDPYVTDAANAAKKDLDKATDEVQTLLDYLKAANNGLKGIVNYVNAQPDIKFTKLGSEFDTKRESFHDQLEGLSDSIKSLSDNASNYSDIINEDLRAVNDQLNVVFNLLADRLVDLEDLSIEELYEEVKDEDIDTITTGRVDICTNKGIVKGDINVGGIAGSMSIDDEDPEDSAAGSIEYDIGRRFITKCLITDSVNEGYITSKKDGAGGICGYMEHGIIVDSESYGSVESTEGDYVGGICGESLTIIKRCYSLCSVSGGKNVGGIAGYAETLTNCYSMADVMAENGRVGAIAGQISSYEEIDSENTDEDDDAPKVADNFYVNDEVYGIDNISYVGVAEPISYKELLTVEQLPTEFWHLKVIYRIEDTYLGSEEVKYGSSLDSLTYPEIPEKSGYYGVWPDVSDKKMSGTVVVEAEYKDDVTVVQSSSVEDQKPLALVEDRFTEDTLLHASIIDMEKPDEASGRKNVIYEITLENGGIGDSDTFAIRLLNPYDEAVVYGYKDGTWTQLDSKSRGQYLQVEMTGNHEYFCIVNDKSYTLYIIIVAAAAVVLIIILAALAKKRRIRRKNKKAQKLQEQAESKQE
jgi:hypothetical protein